MANYVLGRRTPDGINTEVKVRDMQRKLGVKVDGLWGSQTEAAYQASLKTDEKQVDPWGGSERPKSVMDYLFNRFGNDVENWTDTGLGVAGISKFNLPKTVYSEKLAQSDKALSKPYMPTSSNKSANPLSYTSYPVDPDRTAGNAWLQYTMPIDGVSYVKSDRGNTQINGTAYFPTNSRETVTYIPPFDTIDYDFQSKEFFERLNDALPKKYKPLGGDYLYAFSQSRNRKKMDQKWNLDANTLYLFNGKLYNRNEAGNIIWGAAMYKLGFGSKDTPVFADWGALLTVGRPDELHDQRAIQEGWNYMYQLENSNE